MTDVSPASADLFRVLADPTRRAVLERLAGGERTVSDIKAGFSVSQPAISQHLAALRSAADLFAAQGAQGRAGSLQSLEQKVLSATRAPARRRLAPDLEALLQAETIAVQAGPRPFEDAVVLSAVREAVKSLGGLSFRYEGGATPGRMRTVTPLGVLFGRSNYLVAAESEAAGPRNWRLDRIFDIALADPPAPRPAGFSLQDYADQSFGIFHDDTEDVVLRIIPAGAEEALRWRFHANQAVEPQADGSVLVRFRASGMLELAWHLFSWGDKAQVLAPAVLRTTLSAQIELARQGLASVSDASGA